MESINSFFFWLLSFMFENALTHTIGVRLHIISRRNWRCILLIKPKQRSINSKFSYRILRRVYCLSMNTLSEGQDLVELLASIVASF